MMTEYFVQSEIALRRRDMLAAAAESRLARLARAARDALPEASVAAAPHEHTTAQLPRHRRGVVQT
jgi:hypothetical protein